MIQHALQRLGTGDGVRRDHQLAASRHGTHQVVELTLDGGEIREDVGVIELEVIEHGDARPVMHELGTLVEEGRVVFIGLDHEGRPGVADTRGIAQLRRHATDQIARREARAFENPGGHGRGGGLAVGAGDGDHRTAGQHLVTQPLRAGGIGQPTLEQRLDFGVAARDGIADHREIRRGDEIVGRIAFHQGDTGLGQLCAHGRIDVGIAPRDAMTTRARQKRQRAHEGTANTDDVKVHLFLQSGSPSSLACPPGGE